MFKHSDYIKGRDKVRDVIDNHFEPMFVDEDKIRAKQLLFEYLIDYLGGWFVKGDCLSEEITTLKDKLHRRNMQIKDLKAENKRLKETPLRETFNGRSSDLNELDTEEIGRLVKDGNTSGRLNDEKKNIYWELHFNVWED